MSDDSNHLDINRTEVKMIAGKKWQFRFRENGYVIVSGLETKENKLAWDMKLHAVDLDSCLQYVFVNMELKEPINYKELKEAS